jgi:hypothetical protein
MKQEGSFISIAVENIDPDVMGEAWCLGVNPREIQVMEGELKKEHVKNGNGDIPLLILNIFCNHPVCKQCSVRDKLENWGNGDIPDRYQDTDCDSCMEIIEYLHLLNEDGIEEVKRSSSGEPPLLCDVIFGIMSSDISPKEKLLEGVKFLRIIAETQVNPYDCMSDILEKHPGFWRYVSGVTAVL